MWGGGKDLHIVGGVAPPKAPLLLLKENGERLPHKALEESGLEPEDWIVIDYDEMASGDYVGRVEIGGEDTSNGGTVGRGKAITGRKSEAKRS